MLVIPAIDIKGGKCVRLRQGQFTLVETYSEDPVAYALRWQRLGAQRLHVVDLDGARVGMPQNTDVVRRIVRSVSIPVQVGGGIRNAEVVERLLRIGADRVVLGTAVAGDDEAARAILMPYGDRVIVGVDAKDGRVAVSGWLQRLDESAEEFVVRLERLGARRFIYTDISRDGMLGGPNIEGLRRILRLVRVPVIASGGVASVEDVRALAGVGEPNLEGVIIGKALYAGALDLAEAIAAAEGTSV
ncbi:MAG: 1-(5-phosphoribosyl)-5-[(5-phosphoribosylamino)methylideneamino]imidazole-4-carboxamide isomerase [Chthonomonadales bacterium]